MEKRTAHCKLTVIKALIVEGKVRTTQAARVGAIALGFDYSGMLDTVLAHTPITRSGKMCIARTRWSGMCI